MFLKVKVVDGAEDKSDVQYRSLEFTPATTGRMLVKTFKERYNLSEDEKAWGLFFRSESPSAPSSPVTRPMNAEIPPQTQRALSGAKLGQKPVDGIWLDPDRTLVSYGIKIRSIVEVRSTLRAIKITDLDNQLFSKTIQIAQSASIKELLEAIAIRFSISDISSYQLQVIKDKVPVWLESDARIADALQNQIEDRLILRLRFVSPRELDCSDPHFLDMLYVECRTSIIDGAHPTTLQQAVQFAALQMQITHSNYDPLTHVANFLDTKEYLPAEHRQVDLVEEDVYKEHRKLKGLKVREAKIKYAKLLSSLPSFGISYFVAREKTEKSAHYDHDILVGVNFESFLCLHPVTKVVLDRYPLQTQELKFDLLERTVEWVTPANAIRRVQLPTKTQMAQLVSVHKGYVGRFTKKRQQTEEELLIEPVGSVHLSTSFGEFSHLG